MPPLFAKLNLKDQREILVLNPPPSFEPHLASLTGVKILRALEDTRTIGFSLAFVTRLSEIEALAPSLAAKAPGDATIWFAYPKSSSRNYRCEFNRDTGWAALGALGFEGVRQVAIDDDWSALRFRRVEFIKTLRRSADRAMSVPGKARTGQTGTVARTTTTKAARR